jgi:hypothetical protein
VFAAGTADGRRWSLAAVSLAGARPACLPGVVVNGQRGDLLLPGFLPGMAVGNAAFLPARSGRPGPGFAFLRLRPGTTELAASLGDGTRLSLRAVTVSLCGQRFRLAGFSYPPQGVTRITARSAQGQPVSYAPPADIFDPASPVQDGNWVNVQGATANAAAGTIGSGLIGGTPWKMDVTLGPAGECFTVDAGSPGAGDGASICAPVSPPPRTATLTSVPIARHATRGLVWFMGTVSARTASMQAEFSTGQAIWIAPTIVGGRRYIALGVHEGVRLTKLTLYRADGTVLATVTDLPRAR